MQTINLVPADGKAFTVDREIAKCSNTIAGVLADAPNTDAIPLPNIGAGDLGRVYKYLVDHKGDPKPSATIVVTPAGQYLPPPKEEPISEADGALVNDLDNQQLFRLMLAANYMDVRGLLNLCVRTVAAKCLGKTPAEIAKLFELEGGDLTAAEEEEAKAEFPFLNDQ